MPIITVKKIDDILNQKEFRNAAPKKILLGYKVYSALMHDRQFFDEVIGSAMDPNKRKYKNIRIKITQDDYQIEVQRSGK